MATLQQVSEEEWERHKDALKHMYCTEKLPLLNRKGNGHEPGVVELMKERHAFVASPSQYELQFKKWGFTKNLKSAEWAALIAQYDRLCQTKSNVRITVSGSVLDKSKIDKARRRYRLHHIGTQGAMCKGRPLPASRQAHVEFRDESGQWTKESSSQLKNSTALILSKSGPTEGDTRGEDERRLNTPRLDTNPCLLGDRPMDLSLPFQESFPIYRPFSPTMNIDDLLTNPKLTLDDGVFSALLSGSGNLNELPHVSASGSNSTASSVHADSEPDHREIALKRASVVTKSHLEGARALITSLVQHGKMTLCSSTKKPAENLEVEDVMESLESLLPETETSSHEHFGHSLSLRNSCPSSNLFKTLLYSFKNNFAGLGDVPRASIMQLIRENHDIRIQLFEIIKSGRPGVAKPLADTFFRAAVEGNDAEAVATIILYTKSNSNITIDPNEAVCTFEDEDYTPIELAAKFRNTQLVRTLLASRADPNKTCKPDNIRKWAQGALGLALGRWDNGSEFPFQMAPPDEPEPVNIGLLKLLLDFGAEVRIDLMENAMRPGPGHSAVAKELISRIPASEHQICFKSRWLLVSAIHYLENSVADTIVKRLFTHCDESEGCGKCASENSRLIEELLCHAARRANVELTKFLMQHTDQLQSCLAAAIRASSDELIEFLLEKGARVDDHVESWRQCDKPEHSGHDCGLDLYDEGGYDRTHRSDPEHAHYVVTPIRTPLAEAIRSRNQHLLDTFERLGAFTRLSDKHHFHAAVVAAAEVGNTTYLKTILGHASTHNGGSNLLLALAVAIRNDETDTALILLDAGVQLDESYRRYGDPLIAALDRCNKRVVDSMLECDVKGLSPYPVYNGKSALEAAAAWGDIGLINDLTLLGGKIDNNVGIKMTPLGAAVKTRNKIFVSQMLDLGADLTVTVDDLERVTPLQAAFEVGDYDMVRFLISKGAPPADTGAFLYAMSHDPMGYEFLLSEFKTQHPQGLPGFGGRLLAQAIQLGSQPLMESLLKGGADMNSWCETHWMHMQKSEPSLRRHAFSRRRVLGVAILHSAARTSELIRELLDRGADTEHFVYEFPWHSSSETIIIRETPLLLAIHSKKLDVVRMLLQHGANVNRPARRGVKQTPLQAACETGSYSMVEFLLKKGARVNDAAAERYGGTALQLAAKSGSLKIIRLLLDNGADLFMPKSKVGGRTAFEAAAEGGCIDVLCQLWNAVLPLGFSEKECQSAREFAKKKGHRSCVDFIDFLGSGSCQSFLDV